MTIQEKAQAIQEAIQNEVDDQIDQISYELKVARDSSLTLQNYIQERLIQSPTRNELRRATTHCQNVLNTLIDLMGNAPRS